jgi:hypothetical protein
VTTGGSAAVQLETIGWLHALFTEHGVDYWLFGGWAVDFHVGRVTRRVYERRGVRPELDGVRARVVALADRRSGADEHLERLA